MVGMVIEMGFRGLRGRDGAATLPDGKPGQVIGYGADGTPVAVDAPQATPYDDDALRARIAALEGRPAAATLTGLRVANGKLIADMSNNTSLEVSLPAAGGPTVAYDDSALRGRIQALESREFATVATSGKYTDLTGIPASFPPAAHAHAWADVTGKPTSFTPSAHDQAIATITGLQAALDALSARIAAIEAAAPPTATAPKITSRPTLTGSTALGSTITIRLGTASGTPEPVLTGSLKRPGKAAQTVADGATFVVDAADQGGTVSLTVTATNSAGTVSDTASLAIPAAANTAPTLTAIPALSATVGTPFSYTASASDAEGAVTWAWTGLPAGITASGATISGTPTAAGAATITATVTDAGGLTASRSATLTVAAAAQVSITALPDTGPQPVAAWGFRRLNPAYTGPLFRVVRPSDNASRDMAQTSDGNIDLTGYATWAGTDGVGVDLVYDQYGSNHMTQSAAASRPSYRPEYVLGSNHGAVFAGTSLAIPIALTGSGQETTTVDVAYAQSANTGGGYAMLGQAHNGSGSAALVLGNGSGANGRIQILNTTFNTPGFHALSHPQAIVVSQKKTGVEVHVNDRIGTTAATSAGTWAGGFIGKTVQNYTFFGQFFARAIYPAALTTAEIAPIKSALYAMYGINPAPVIKLVLTGNSIVQGSSAARVIYNSTRQARPLITATNEIVNAGVFGEAASKIYDDRAVYYAARDASRSRNFLLAPEPTNDIDGRTAANISGAAASLWSGKILPFIEGAVAAGYVVQDILVPTTLPRKWSGEATSEKEIERQAYNKLVRDNAATVGYTVFDQAGIPAMANPLGPNYSDGIHPNSTNWQQGLEVSGNGYGYIAKLLADTINMRLAA